MKHAIQYFIFSLCLNSSFVSAYWSSAPIDPALSQRTHQNAVFLDLDLATFKESLNDISSQQQSQISLPRADGSLNQFWFQQTQVLDPSLALKYPNFKTYKIQHILDSSITGRMELINDALSAVIKTTHGQEHINTTTILQRYKINKRTVRATTGFSCGNTLMESNRFLLSLPNNHRLRTATNSLKKLRVAIATTTEYSAKFGTTKADVLGEITSAINRINDVFESDLAITLQIINDNEKIIFLTSDSFDNDNAATLIDQSQTVIDNVIGSGNYDLGHVFSTGGGGLAGVGVVCDSSQKAQGVTGISNPTGDPFWIDYVAHEMGHQLGAEHTFNGTEGSCSTRFAASAVEPGSGSTIMAYAGICGVENLQSNTDANFHTTSITEIDNVLSRSSLSSCGSNVSNTSIFGSSNTASPIISAIADDSIPVSTPFILSGNATDANSDTLYYQWDGKNIGTATNSNTIGCDLGDNALIRSNKASTSNTRYVPSIKSLLSGSSHIGETLAATARNLNFRLKVTDNFGGIDTDDFVYSTDNSIGPFKVTSQTTAQSFSANQSVTVTWDVANTTSAPVSCQTVTIKLLNINSTNENFCSQNLATGLSNNGSAQVVLPNEVSMNSRFIIQCESSPFFAMNEANISISGGSSTASNSCLSTSDGILSDSSTQVPSTSNCAISSNNSSSINTNTSSSSGGGILNLYFLLIVIFFACVRTRAITYEV